MSILDKKKETSPEIHPDMYQYLSKDQIKLNQLLFDLDEAIDLHENGDTHFLCDLHGVCSAVDDEKDKDDGFKSECFFCGADLIVHKGNYYHYSAFHDMAAFKRNYTSYTTHNNFKYTYGTDPVSKEQEKVFEIKKEIDIISHKIKNTKDQLMNKTEKYIKVGDPKFTMLSRNYDPTDPDHTVGDVDYFECMLENMLDEARANENETEINAIQNELQLLSQLTLQGVERIILN